MDTRGVMAAFVLTLVGAMLLITLLYIFTRAVSYATYMTLERDLDRARRRRDSGREGEETVAHELGFLPREFKVLHNLVVDVPDRKPQQIDQWSSGRMGCFISKPRTTSVE